MLHLLNLRVFAFGAGLTSALGRNRWLPYALQRYLLIIRVYVFRVARNMHMNSRSLRLAMIMQMFDGVSTFLFSLCKYMLIVIAYSVHTDIITMDLALKKTKIQAEIL